MSAAAAWRQKASRRQRELAVSIGTAQSDLALQRDAAVLAKTALDAATQAYQAAALTDQAFTEHVEADKAFKVMKAEGDTMAGLGQRIARARSALLLADAEQAVDGARKAMDDMARLAVTAVELQQEAEAKAQTAAERLKALVDKTADHDRHKADLLDCQGHAKRFDASAGQQEAATNAAAKALADKKRAGQSRAQHDERTRAFVQLVRQLDDGRAAALRRAGLRTRELEASQALQSARLYERAQSQLASDRKSLERLEAEAGAVVAQLTARQAAFNAAEAALLQNHALHVAEHLVDGEPCPACGSPDHPAPAHGSARAGSVGETYQREKAALESACKRCEEARTRAESARATFDVREAEFKELAVPARPAKALDEEHAGIRTALETLAPDVDLDALDAKHVELEGVAAALATYQADEAAAQGSDKAAALARQSLDDALQAIPPELRNRQRLAERQDALAHKIADFSAAVESARKGERATNDALIAARTATANAAGNKGTAEAQLKAAQSSFAQRVADAGLTEVAYRESKGDIPCVAELEAKITDHQERLIRVDERLKKAASAIKDTDRPDIKSLKDAMDEAETALAAASELAAGMTARQRQLEKLASELSAEIARLDRLEQETGPLRELADAFTGRNDMKIHLETFAIATMFDHVLEAANLRLGPMSRVATRSSVNPKVGATPDAASRSPSMMPAPGANARHQPFPEARRSSRPWLSPSVFPTSSKAPAAMSASTPSSSTRASAALMRTAMAAHSSRFSRPCKTLSGRTVRWDSSHTCRSFSRRSRTGFGLPRRLVVARSKCARRRPNACLSSIRLALRAFCNKMRRDCRGDSPHLLHMSLRSNRCAGRSHAFRCLDARRPLPEGPTECADRDAAAACSPEAGLLAELGTKLLHAYARRGRTRGRPMLLASY